MVGGATVTDDLIHENGRISVLKMDQDGGSLDYVADAAEAVTSTTRGAQHMIKSATLQGVMYMADYSLPGQVLALQLDLSSGDVSLLSTKVSVADQVSPPARPKNTREGLGFLNTGEC